MTIKNMEDDLPRRELRGLGKPFKPFGEARSLTRNPGRKRRRRKRKQTKAEAYVRRKVDYLIHEEGYEPKQAVRVAYELARRKYGARGRLRRPGR